MIDEELWFVKINFLIRKGIYEKRDNFIFLKNFQF